MMNIQRTVLRSAVILVATLAVGCGDGDDEKRTKIPLDSIYSTNEQKGLKSVLADQNYKTCDREFGALRTKQDSGASNVFIVQGREISNAVKETHKVFFQIHSGERISISKSEDHKAWMVVFFGVSQSSPRQWTIDSVERANAKIKLCYSTPGPGKLISADNHWYYAWVPLEDIKTGKYEFELYDSTAKNTTLVRSCLVVHKEAD